MHLRKLTITDFSKSQDFNLKSKDFEMIRHSSKFSDKYERKIKQNSTNHRNFDKNSIFVSHNYKSTHNAYEQMLPKTMISGKRFSEGGTNTIGKVLIVTNQITDDSSDEGRR